MTGEAVKARRIISWILLLCWTTPDGLIYHSDAFTAANLAPLADPLPPLPTLAKVITGAHFIPNANEFYYYHHP